MLSGMERRGAVIPVLLLLIFILLSCGRKGPPLPPIENDGAETLSLMNNVQQD